MRQLPIQYLINPVASLQSWSIMDRTNKVLQLILVLVLIHPITAPVFCGTGMQTDGLPHPFLIVPQPKHTEILKGTGLEAGQLEHLSIMGNFDRPIMGTILSQLTESELQGAGNPTLRMDDSESLPCIR